MSWIGCAWTWIADHATVIATVVSTIATGVVAWFTITLAKAALGLKASADQQIAEAKALREIAGQQTAIQGLQADIAKKQHGLGRVQFFADHRPRVVLKDVFFSAAGRFDTLTFELANIGGSEAKVTGGFVAIGFVTDHRRFKSMAEGSLDSVDSANLQAGELRQFDRAVPSDVQYHMRFPNAARILNVDNPRPPLGKLYFFGSLLYVDGRGEEFGIVRMSVFRREWRPEEGAFCRTNNPDHEYAD